VDWAEVTRSYGKDFVEKGGNIHLNFEVTSFKATAESSPAAEGDGNKYPVSVLGRGGVSFAHHRRNCLSFYSVLLSRIKTSSLIFCFGHSCHLLPFDV
jgi:hypothetical protein